MFILSNKSILAILAMAACMASFANAEGTRGRARKLMKSSKSGTQQSLDALQNSFVPPPIFNPDTNTDMVSSANTVASFEDKCTDGVLSAIESCSPLRPFICKTCVVSQSNLNAPTVNGVLKCGNINISQRICYGCDDQVILDYYNCGTGENMMLPGLTTPAMMGGNTTIVGNTTVGSGTTTIVGNTTVGSGTTTTVTATISSSDGTTPGPPPDASYCPPENVAAGEYIKSGDICNTSGYEYLQCYYPGKVCSCYAIQPLFSCLAL